MRKEQDRIRGAEEQAKRQLAATETDLEGWREILGLAIKLAGNCHDAYLKAGPKVRRRLNEAVLKSVHIRDGQARVHRPARGPFFRPGFE